MGMTIDKSIAELEVLKKNTFSYMPAHQSFITAIDTMRKYQMVQADYEARLKADLVAMLTEIQLEIEEIQSSQDCCDYAIDNCISRCDVADLIQQKIDKLKENTDEKESSN